MVGFHNYVGARAGRELVRRRGQPDRVQPRHGACSHQQRDRREDPTLHTGLRRGTYCDVIHGRWRQRRLHRPDRHGPGRRPATVPSRATTRWRSPHATGSAEPAPNAAGGPVPARRVRRCRHRVVTDHPIDCWLTDMDGVLVHEGIALRGAPEFLARLRERGRRFVVLTNNSIFTARDLAGPAPPPRVSTCPSTPSGPRRWRPRSSSRTRRRAGPRYAIGEAGLTTALHEHRLRAHGHRSRLRGARGDPHLLVRGHHAGHPAGGRRRPFSRHEPRPHRPLGGGAVARLRGRGRPHHQGHGRPALRDRQAQPDDVPLAR